MKKICRKNLDIKFIIRTFVIVESLIQKICLVMEKIDFHKKLNEVRNECLTEILKLVSASEDNQVNVPFIFARKKMRGLLKN